MGNDGKPREIKGCGEFNREKMKSLELTLEVFFRLYIYYCQNRKNPLHFTLFFLNSLKPIITSVNENSIKRGILWLSLHLV